jgi:hypothetical protein
LGLADTFTPLANFAKRLERWGRGLEQRGGFLEQRAAVRCISERLRVQGSGKFDGLPDIAVIARGQFALQFDDRGDRTESVGELALLGERHRKPDGEFGQIALVLGPLGGPLCAIRQGLALLALGGCEIILQVVGAGHDVQPIVGGDRHLVRFKAARGFRGMQPIHTFAGRAVRALKIILRVGDGYGGEVIARVAQEHGVVGHVARRRCEALRTCGGGRLGREFAARRQAPMQLVDEALGTDIDASAYAHLLQKGHEALILAGGVVGHDLADIARIGEPLALGHAQEQPRQPVGEVAADEQQMVVFEFVKQLLWREVFALQRTDELEQILIRQDVGGRGGHAAKQVINHRPLQAVALAR